MKISELSDTQKENLSITFDNDRFCVFCKEKFGFTFVRAFDTIEELQDIVRLYSLKPKMDHGASLKFQELSVKND